METAMVRKGNKARIGGVSVTVPSDMSMLALVSVNEFGDNEEYRDDGWVYQAGERKKKWFRPLEGDRRIWSPKLDNLASLERSRWNVLQWAERRTKFSWKKIFAEIAESKPAVGVFPGQDDRPIVLYYVERGPDSGVSWSDIGQRYGSNYSRKIAETGEENQDLIDRYFRGERRVECYYRRAGLFDEAFKLAVSNFLFDNFREEMRRDLKPLIKLTINGRVYWFEKRGLKKLAYPEDTLDIDVSVSQE